MLPFLPFEVCFMLRLLSTNKFGYFNLIELFWPNPMNFQLKNLNKFIPAVEDCLRFHFVTYFLPIHIFDFYLIEVSADILSHYFVVVEIESLWVISAVFHLFQFNLIMLATFYELFVYSCINYTFYFRLRIHYLNIFINILDISLTIQISTLSSIPFHLLSTHQSVCICLVYFLLFDLIILRSMTISVQSSQLNASTNRSLLKPIHHLYF